MIEDIPDFDALDSEGAPDLKEYPHEDPLDSEYHELMDEREQPAREDG